MKAPEPEPDDLFENNIDPKKLFDENEYSTIIVSKDGLNKKDAERADMLEVLVSGNSSREEKDEALKLLKEKEAAAFILDTVRKTKNPKHKALLIAACWETGLDFSSSYSYFAGLVAGTDYLCALEAYTVLENMESTPPRPELEKALDILNNAKDKNNRLVLDALALTQQQLNPE